jgi:hypothetical protein
MKPTLKPGCLAMIVKSAAGNEGKIVTCVRYIPNYKFVEPFGYRPSWQVDRQLPAYGTSTGTWMNDTIPASWLIPINDPDLEIEIETKQDIQLKEKV